MKIRKTVFFTVLAVTLILSATICGAAAFPSSIELALTFDSDTVFSKTYPCSASAALKTRILYGGDYTKLYKSRFSGDPKSFFGYLNENIYSDVVAAIESKNIEPTEPSVRCEGGGVFRYSEGSQGIICDEKATLEALASRLKSPIEYKFSEPKTSIEALKEVTVKAASHTTYYSDSSAERKKNVELAAKKLDGAAVLPRQTLSFNETVGQRTKENGFYNAKVIVNGEYIEGTGGGVCQVSTTLYNAWLKTGQNAAYSRAHSLKPSYVTPGLDAMVSDKSDLILSNETDYTIYICAQADGKALTVSIYTRPLPCDITLSSELLKTIYCDEYEETDGDSDEVIAYPKNGAVYRSYREFSENGEIYLKEYLRTSTYLPRKGKKFRKKTEEPRIEAEG